MQKRAIARRLGYVSSIIGRSNQHGRSISLYRDILDTREDVDGLSETLRESIADMYQST